MPKAIKNIELTELPQAIEVNEPYDGAFILLRYFGKVIGKVTLPAKDQKIILKDHIEAIQQAVEKHLWFAGVEHFLSDGEEKAITGTGVTVAVCTRNRTEDLKLCLQALMRIKDKGQEIIVVDNAPSDNSTRELVAQFPSVHYVLEQRKGLDVARNRALAEASNEIVVFTDDDALPEPDWIEKIVPHFDDPLVVCVTGMTMPLEQETEAQEAIENYSPFAKGYFRKRFSFTKSHPLSTGSIGAGANMAIRKAVIEEIGGFDEALDAGTKTQSGGDHEFFARILLAGYHIVYEPEAMSWHRHRRTWEEAVSAIHGYGVGVYAFWTRLFYVEKQYSIILFSKRWLLDTQLPNLYRSMFKIGKHYPLSFVFAELRGCLKGPFAYFKSRRLVNHFSKKQEGK
ncbi:MAG: glycosyltransferase family 2 protein [Flavisolibacter sp.]